ncbi:hypothetical protein [Kordia antarctica]|nr:hypothetical protein [Kordia antarctica]
MTKEKSCDRDKKLFEKFKNFGLPYSFKKIGIAIILLSILTIIIAKTADFTNPTLKFAMKRIMLIGLLVIALAREKIEDERILTMRGQAFSMAFIAGVVYTLIQPLVNYIADLFVKDDKGPLTDLGDFQILWFLLTMYLLFFYMLKRKS